MAVRVRQQVYNEQPVMPEQPQHQPSIQKQKKPKSSFYMTGKEKLVFLAFMAIVVCFAVALLNTQSQIQTATIDLQALETQAEVIAKENVDLKVQVSERSTYERIWEKAQELGLSLNEKNVKVVPSE